MNNIRLSDIYQRRFRNAENINSQINRMNAWVCLYEKVLKNLIKPDMTVLDLGSGPGFFINQVSAMKCIAVDADITNEKFMGKNIEFKNVKAQNLDFIDDDSVNLIFSSNLFEHLNSNDELFEVLHSAHRVLKKGNSKIVILMPNIRFAKWDFFNFIDHKLPLNENSLSEALELANFEILSCYPRFFPYSANSSSITWPIFVIKAYLSLPPRMRPLAKQMFFVAQPAIMDK